MIIIWLFVFICTCIGISYCSEISLTPFSVNLTASLYEDILPSFDYNNSLLSFDITNKEETNLIFKAIFPTLFDPILIPNNDISPFYGTSLVSFLYNTETHLNDIYVIPFDFESLQDAAIDVDYSPFLLVSTECSSIGKVDAFFDTTYFTIVVNCNDADISLQVYNVLLADVISIAQNAGVTDYLSGHAPTLDPVWESSAGDRNMVEKAKTPSAMPAALRSRLRYHRYPSHDATHRPPLTTDAAIDSAMVLRAVYSGGYTVWVESVPGTYSSVLFVMTKDREEVLASTPVDDCFALSAVSLRNADLVYFSNTRPSAPASTQAFREWLDAPLQRLLVFVYGSSSVMSFYFDPAPEGKSLQKMTEFDISSTPISISHQYIYYNATSSAVSTSVMEQEVVEARAVDFSILLHQSYGAEDTVSVWDIGYCEFYKDFQYTSFADDTAPFCPGYTVSYKFNQVNSTGLTALSPTHTRVWLTQETAGGQAGGGTQYQTSGEYQHVNVNNMHFGTALHLYAARKPIDTDRGFNMLEGLCPYGFYCSLGTSIPQPCNPHTQFCPIGSVVPLDPYTVNPDTVVPRFDSEFVDLIINYVGYMGVLNPLDKGFWILVAIYGIFLTLFILLLKITTFFGNLVKGLSLNRFGFFSLTSAHAVDVLKHEHKDPAKTPSSDDKHTGVMLPYKGSTATGILALMVYVTLALSAVVGIYVMLKSYNDNERNFSTVSRPQNLRTGSKNAFSAQLSLNDEYMLNELHGVGWVMNLTLSGFVSYFEVSLMSGTSRVERVVVQKDKKQEAVANTCLFSTVEEFLDTGEARGCRTACFTQHMMVSHSLVCAPDYILQPGFDPATFQLSEEDYTRSFLFDFKNTTMRLLASPVTFQAVFDEEVLLDYPDLLPYLSLISATMAITTRWRSDLRMADDLPTPIKNECLLYWETPAVSIGFCEQSPWPANLSRSSLEVGDTLPIDMRNTYPTSTTGVMSGEQYVEVERVGSIWTANPPGLFSPTRYGAVHSLSVVSAVSTSLDEDDLFSASVYPPSFRVDLVDASFAILVESYPILSLTKIVLGLSLFYATLAGVFALLSKILDMYLKIRPRWKAKRDRKKAEKKLKKASKRSIRPLTPKAPLLTTPLLTTT